HLRGCIGAGDVAAHRPGRAGLRGSGESGRDGTDGQPTDGEHTHRGVRRRLWMQQRSPHVLATRAAGGGPGPARPRCGPTPIMRSCAPWIVLCCLVAGCGNVTGDPRHDVALDGDSVLEDVTEMLDADVDVDADATVDVEMDVPDGDGDS